MSEKSPYMEGQSATQLDGRVSFELLATALACVTKVSLNKDVLSEPLFV